MSKKLFVGNLPFSVADADLSELFSKAGTVVSATVIVDKYNNRSKGFGFVEMSTEEEAQKAIDTLNGKDVEGRNITVSEARPLEDRPKRESRDFRRR
jgi:RNA recognition motif-containing protein